MSKSVRRLPRWLGRRPAAGAAPAAPPAGEGAPHTVLEECGEHGERFLLRSSADRRTSVRELARSLPADPERPVVVVDVAPEAAGNLGDELGGLFARLRAEERTAARLVMSGAAAPTAGRSPLAQRLADAWELDLEAPDAATVLVPGGGLYVTEPADPAGGWWRFAPGAPPEALGARIPAPHWQRALARVPLGALGGHTVQQIPAGLMLRPSGTPAPRPGDPAFALAVHPDRLTVLAGAGPRGPSLVEDLATLLAGLPAGLRRSVRLVPGAGYDLLPAAEGVADLLGTEVEVCTGLPLATPWNGPATAHTEAVRLCSAEGAYTWPALLTSVVCAPTEPDGHRPAHRPAHWALPGGAGSAAGQPATLRLPGGQYVVAVRAGLWIGGSPVPPPAVRDRPAEARAVRIEIDGAATADGTARAHLLEGLSALLATLDGTVREHAELAPPEDADAEAVAGLRRFAVHNGLSFAAAGRPVAAAVGAEAHQALPAAFAPVPAFAPAPEPAPAVPHTSPVTSSPTSPPPLTPTPVPPPSPPPTRPVTSSSGHTAPPPVPEALREPSAEPTGAPVVARTSAPVPARAATAMATATATDGFSSGSDRAAFRELASAVWEEHSGPVHQALVRLPGLRGPAEGAARADLVAVYLYLSSPPDGPFGARALAADAGTGPLRPYAVCLASGLRRLPSLRGSMLRAVPGRDIPDDLVTGAVLYCDAPLDVVHLEQKGAPLPPDEHVRYVLRSVTARRTSVLRGAGNSASALFGAGTAFSVLARHEATDDTPARVLLAELPGGPGPSRAPSAEAAARLDTAGSRVAAATDPPWPDRCTGPFLSAPFLSAPGTS